MRDRSARRAGIAERLGLTDRFNVAAQGRPPLWVAGINIEQAAMIDIVAVPDVSRWLLGPTTSVRHQRLVPAAEVALEARVARYREVLDDSTNPLERLHLYTNAAAVTDVLGAAVVAGGIAARTVIGVVPDGR